MIGKKVIEFGKCKSLTSDKTMVVGSAIIALLKFGDTITCTMVGTKICPQ